MPIISVPAARGNGRKSWGKLVTSVAKNAASGNEWEGPWITPSADGEGACLYIVAPSIKWHLINSSPCYRNVAFRVEFDGTKKWGAVMAVYARKILAMSVEQRCEIVKKQRRAEIVESREKATAKGSEQFRWGDDWIPGTEAVARYNSMLAFADAEPSEPKNPLEEFTTDQILAELARRGVSATA